MTREQIERFEILLEHDIDEQYQYEPGETLRGSVVLVLNEPIKVKAIQVQIKGESTVSWEEETGRDNPAQFKAAETYIDVSQNLLVAHTGNLITLDPGSHRYPMEYALPDTIPSSFIGKFGSITYVLKATLKEDKKFGLSTMITSEPFLVLRRMDISQEHKLQMAREERVDKSFSGALAFCSRGKVTCTFRVNKTGHIPGEDIFMDAEITNQSPRTVEAVEASIIMHSTFHARSKKKYSKQIVNKKRDDWEVTEGEGRRWKGVRLTIPPYIPESRLDGCDIIDIKYDLEFRIEISSKSQIIIIIPITIGTANNMTARRSHSQSTADPHISNWHSRDNLGDSAMHTNGKDLNGLHPSDIDLHEMDDATLRFRRPLDVGDIRNNPLAQYDLDNLPPNSPQ